MKAVARYLGLAVLLAVMGSAQAAVDLSVAFDWTSEVLAARANPNRIALSRPVNLDSDRNGTWSVRGDVAEWTATVRIPGARGVGAIYTSTGLPAGAQILEKSGGAPASPVELHSRGLIPIVNGQVLQVILRVPAAQKGVGSLSILSAQGAFVTARQFLGKPAASDDGSMDWDAAEVRTKAATAAVASDQNNPTCLLNYMCQLESDPDHLDPVRRAAVAVFVNNDVACSGTIVNNKRNDGKLYVLTAEHCDENDGSSAIDATFFYDYEAACPQDVKTASVIDSHFTTGGVIRAKYQDLMLLEITGTVPAGTSIYQMGIDAGDNVPASLVGALHTGGYPKSYGAINGIALTQPQADHYLYTTQGLKGFISSGASGGGMIENFKYVRGVVSAGFGGQECTTLTNTGVLTPISTSWLHFDHGTAKSFQGWLDPDNTGLKVIDGREFDATPIDLTISASRTSVPNNGTTVISWSTTGAAACTAGGSWSGAKATSGSETVSVGGGPTNKTYGLSCTRGAVSVVKSVTVSVVGPLGSTVNLNVNKTKVNVGDSVVLSWDNSRTNVCTAGGAWSGTKNADSGSETVSVGTTPGTKTFTMSCTTNISGTISKNVSVTVAAVPPTSSISSSASSAVAGSSVTLTWTSTNTTSCTAGGAWSGSKAISGAEAVNVGNTAGTNDYSLSCTGPGGTVIHDVGVTVTAAPAPTLSLGSDSTAVATGGSVLLTWSSVNASSCTASGDWSGSKATSGSQGVAVGSTAGSRNYALACTGIGGSISKNVGVTVSSIPPPDVTFSTSTPTVHVGDAIALAWTSSGATSCIASGNWSGSKAINGSESLTATAEGSFSYVLACTGAGGTQTKSANVSVSAAPASGSGSGGGGSLGILFLGPMLLGALRKRLS